MRRSQQGRLEPAGVGEHRNHPVAGERHIGPEGVVQEEGRPEHRQEAHLDTPDTGVAQGSLVAGLQVAGNLQPPAKPRVLMQGP